MPKMVNWFTQVKWEEKNGCYFHYFYPFNTNYQLFLTEKRCGFSHEAHDLKVAGSNPASVKGLQPVGCGQGEDGKKRYSIFTVSTNLISVVN